MIAITKVLVKFQRYMMNKYFIRVFVKQGVAGNFAFDVYLWNFDNNLGKWERVTKAQSFYTYNEALREGIKFGLSFVTKERKELIRKNTKNNLKNKFICRKK